MPADEPRLYGLIGAVQAQVEHLSNEMHTRHAETVKEQRTVHDIVVAQSEAVRNIARDIAEMKPHVEAYKMKAADIDEALAVAEDYKERQAEKRGADKFKSALYGMWAGFGALVVFLLGKLWDMITLANGRPPHPIVALLLLVMSTQALAHDSWISRGGLRNGAGEWCCGEGDCAVMDDGAVSEVAAGMHFNGVGRIGEGAGQVSQRYNEVVPFSEIAPSPDGRYWRCKRPDGTRRCVFGPPPGS